MRMIGHLVSVKFTFHGGYVDNVSIRSVRIVLGCLHERFEARIKYEGSDGVNEHAVWRSVQDGDEGANSNNKA